MVCPDHHTIHFVRTHPLRSLKRGFGGREGMNNETTVSASSSTCVQALFHQPPQTAGKAYLRQFGEVFGQAEPNQYLTLTLANILALPRPVLERILPPAKVGWVLGPTVTRRFWQ